MNEHQLSELIEEAAADGREEWDLSWLELTTLPTTV
jgi:hypothetical protein